MGPLVTQAHRDKVASYLDVEDGSGAEVLVDGRDGDFDADGDGFFLAPSLIDRVEPGMRQYDDEIFGPVLSIVRAGDYEEALALASDHQYGNGVAIFTRNGHAAREFAARVNVGMVGVNVPIPVPMAWHGFGGWKRSLFGDTHAYGEEGVRFYTKQKSIMQRWSDSIDAGAEFVMPTAK